MPSHDSTALFSYLFAELGNFSFARLNISFVFDTAKPDTTAAFYFKVTVKMLDSLYQTLTLFHIRTGSQNQCIASLAFG